MKVLISQKSYGGSEVLEIETRIRLIQQHSTSFVFEGHDSDTQIYTLYHSGLNYPSVKRYLTLNSVLGQNTQKWFEYLSTPLKIGR